LADLVFLFGFSYNFVIDQPHLRIVVKPIKLFDASNHTTFLQTANPVKVSPDFPVAVVVF